MLNIANQVNERFPEELGPETKGTWDDADLESVNGGCIGEEAIDHTSLDVINSICHVDLGGGGIYSESIVST
jgi:hypothetical protein